LFWLENNNRSYIPLFTGLFWSTGTRLGWGMGREGGNHGPHHVTIRVSNNNYKKKKTKIDEGLKHVHKYFLEGP